MTPIHLRLGVLKFQWSNRETAKGAIAMTTTHDMRTWPLEHGYLARATLREGNGWVIRIFAHDEAAPDQRRLVGTTECANLEKLEETAWTFVHQIDDDPAVHIAAAPDLDDNLMMRVVGAWKAMGDAKEAEAAAAQQVRGVVRELRDAGLSLTDIAFIAHVSRGRVSQLLISGEKKGQ